MCMLNCSYLFFSSECHPQWLRAQIIKPTKLVNIYKMDFFWENCAVGQFGLDEIGKSDMKMKERINIP